MWSQYDLIYICILHFEFEKTYTMFIIDKPLEIWLFCISSFTCKTHFSISSNEYHSSFRQIS